MLQCPLLPQHPLAYPLVDPVAVSVTDHGIQQVIVAMLCVGGRNARQHFADFQRIGAAPGPQQMIEHAIPVAVGVPLQRRVHISTYRMMGTGD
ncbi:hypothetical protein D3C75_996350 [compost metagenome]